VSSLSLLYSQFVWIDNDIAQDSFDDEDTNCAAVEFFEKVMNRFSGIGPCWSFDDIDAMLQV